MSLLIILLFMPYAFHNLNNNKGLAFTVALILFYLLVREKCVRYITVDKGTYNFINNLWIKQYRQ